MADLTMNFKYTKGVTKFLKNKMQPEILKSFEEHPVLKKEMRRVFNMANKRIQGIEQAGLFSPAVAQLDLDKARGFSKFKLSDDWSKNKHEYAKAISFLNQPTSTTRGTRQFNKQLQESFGWTGDKSELFERFQEKLINDFATISGDLLNALPYFTFMQEIYERATYETFNSVEEEAKYIEEQLQKSIDSATNNATDELESIMAEWEDNFRIKFD